MKKLLPHNIITLPIIIAAGLLTLVCLGFVPRVVASDMPTGFSLNASELEHLLNNAPDTALPNGNTKDGQLALQNVTTGAWDSAFGAGALYSTTTGTVNTGTGVGTLFHNVQGTHNVANGALALYFNTNGLGNSAVGYGALYRNQSGIGNSAIGGLAGLQITGNFNTALGVFAGINLTTGDNDIALGSPGVAGESNAIRIGNPATHESLYVAGTVPMNPDTPNQVVIIDPASGQLGRADAASLPATGLPAVLFDYNSGTISIGVGGAVPFSQPPLMVGTAITKNNNTTFMVNESGVYRVSYTLRTAVVSLLGNVQVKVNGVGVGPTAALVVAGVPLSDQVTFMANAGDTVQLVVGGLALTLGTGDNATINIDKLQ
jgi:BclA C-terminal domain